MKQREKQKGRQFTDEAHARSAAKSGPIPLGIRLDEKYDVQRVLGRGSMGFVYLGRDIKLERDVAIKVLSPRYAADQRVSRRFRREAIAMASVRAENVVQIFSYGDFHDYPYFVMEYVAGYTVASLIETAADRGEQLYLDVVLGILRQVCRGLHAVHECGIVHRDVKPPNMLVGPHFRVSLTDFGLVETLDDATDVRDLAGTPLYLAPELIRREQVPDNLRHMVDIYALGVSTHELLTGEVPFDGSSIKEILQKHLQEDPPPSRTFVLTCRAPSMTYCDKHSPSVRSSVFRAVLIS
jgi:serine/threonine protein kinase